MEARRFRLESPKNEENTKDLTSLEPPRPPYNEKQTVRMRRLNETNRNPNNTTPMDVRINMPLPEDLETVLVPARHESENEGKMSNSKKNLSTIIERNGGLYKLDQAPTDSLTNEERAHREQRERAALETLIEENGRLVPSNRQFTKDLIQQELPSVKEGNDFLRETIAGLNGAQNRKQIPSSPPNYDTANLAPPGISEYEKNEINRRMSQITTMAQPPQGNHADKQQPINFSDTQELNSGRIGDTIDLNVSGNFNKPGTTQFTLDKRSSLPADTDPSFRYSMGPIIEKQEKLEAMMGTRREVHIKYKLPELLKGAIPPAIVEMHVSQDPTSYESGYVKQYLGLNNEGPRQKVAVIAKETYVAAQVPDNYFLNKAIKTTNDLQLVLREIDIAERDFCRKKGLPEKSSKYIQYKFKQRAGDNKTTVELPDKNPVLIVHNLNYVLEELPDAQHTGVPKPEHAQPEAVLGHESQEVPVRLAINDIKEEIKNAQHIIEYGRSLHALDSLGVDQHLVNVIAAKERILKEQFRKNGRDITDQTVQEEIKKKSVEAVVRELPNEIEDALRAHTWGVASQMAGMIKTGGLREKVNELLIEKIATDNARLIKDTLEKFKNSKQIRLFFHPDSGAIFGLQENEREKPIVITPHIDQFKPDVSEKRYQETMRNLIFSGKLIAAIATIKDGKLTVDPYRSSETDMYQGVLKKTVETYNAEPDN